MDQIKHVKYLFSLIFKASEAASNKTFSRIIKLTQLAHIYTFTAVD